MSENNKNNTNTIEEQIRELDREIEVYQQAIENAEGALDAAEKELSELLAAAYGQENLIDPYPD